MGEVASAVRIERRPLRGLGVLSAPRLRKRRRLDRIGHLQSGSQGVAAGIEGNQESRIGLRSPWLAVVDTNAPGADRAVADPAGTKVAGDHPGARAGKMCSVQKFPAVTEAGVEKQ